MTTEETTGQMHEVRVVAPDDTHAVLRLNEAAIPAVTPMDDDLLSYFVGAAEHLVGVDDVDGNTVAFLVLLPPGLDDYPSLNYAWFSERFDDFLYVDRIVVDPSAHRRGIGRRLYEFAVEQAAGRPVLAEVNLRPRNDVSLAFHERLGFEQLGTQELDHGSKEVVMLCRRG